MARTAAILLSRQPLRPYGSTPWVANTVAAIRWLKDQDVVLCSSVGMQTWELVTAVASMERIPLRLYLPSSLTNANNGQVAIFRNYALDGQPAEFCQVEESARATKEDILMRRDEAVVHAADILIPISIRPGGHMAALLESARATGKEIVKDFEVSKPSRKPMLTYHLDSAALNPDIDSVAGQYLIHWTRTSNSAWQDERLIDYYAAIVRSEAYPRSALDTLRHIVSSRRIIASARHMPENIPTVALSSLPPREVIPLMRWRTRYSEMSFEPYGIGIRTDFAARLNIRPAVYYEGKNTPPEASATPWLCQSIGSKTDWRQEQEYRHKGDLLLDGLPKDALCLFCRFPEEALQLERDLGIKAISLQT